MLESTKPRTGRRRRNSCVHYSIRERKSHRAMGPCTAVCCEYLCPDGLAPIRKLINLSMRSMHKRHRLVAMRTTRDSTPRTRGWKATILISSTTHLRFGAECAQDSMDLLSATRQVM